MEGHQSLDSRRAGSSVGSLQEISLEITELGRGQFKGVFRWGHADPIPVKGSFQGDMIEWTGDGFKLATYKAKIDGNYLTGECGNGTFKLELISEVRERGGPSDCRLRRNPRDGV